MMKETEQTQRLRRQLDEVALAFHLCRWTTSRPDGWLKAVRTALGISAGTLAKRMGVIKWDVYQLEKSEEKASIQMRSLQRAAEAMGCELVYAVIPKVGTVGALAARERVEAEAAEEAARAERIAKEREERNSPAWREQAREALLANAELYGLPLRAIGQ